MPAFGDGRNVGERAASGRIYWIASRGRIGNSTFWHITGVRSIIGTRDPRRVASQLESVVFGRKVVTRVRSAKDSI